jgi:pyruvate/2-oxoacid:ferredoxin oxidoreductase alpha subunit
MPTYVPDQEDIDEFLPKYIPKWKLDVKNPITFGNIIGPEYYEKIRRDMQTCSENAKKIIVDITKEWEKRFDRTHGDLIERYQCEDAEYILLSMGAIGSESKVAIDRLREKHYKIGLARVRTFRPFPKDEILSLSKHADLIVIDRNISIGSEGALFNEVKAALYGKSDAKVHGYIAGLGGKDVTYLDIETMCTKIIEKKNDRDCEWYGLEGV